MNNMKKRSGKYPNKADFQPHYGKKMTKDGKFNELPLSDPAESHTTVLFEENEKSYADAKNKPSAFSENKKIQLEVNGSPV